MSAIADPRQRTIMEVLQSVPVVGFTVADIVHPCDRYIWYVIRRALPAPRADYRETATRQAILAGLRALGCVVHDMQPNGAPYAVTAFSGHVSVAFTGGVRGLLEAPDTWHALSLAPRPADVDELIFIMGNTGMTRAYHVNTLTFQAERVKASPFDYKAQLDRLERVIYSDEPPERMHADPSEDRCRACPAHGICHHTDVPPPNCESCCHVTPQRDGDWVCEYHNVKRDGPLRAQGCQSHRYIPILLEQFATLTDSSREGNWVSYTTPHGTFTNGTPPEGFESQEIHALGHKRALTDTGTVAALRKAFNGRVVA